MSVNTTRLRRRIAKYVEDGGFDSHVGTGIGYGYNFVNYLRKGKELREATLQKASDWLTERGY